MIMFKNLIAAAVVTTFAIPAFASKEGVLTINGKVPEACEIVVQANDVAKGILDLSLGATDLHVGSVSEKCNDSNGYMVTVQLKNGVNSVEKGVSGLFRDEVSRATLPFALSYGGKMVTESTVTDSNKPAIEFITKDVAISYAADDTLPSSQEFSYSEQMRFVITAK